VLYGGATKHKLPTEHIDNSKRVCCCDGLKVCL
jgi:hypothetical protein